MSFSGKLITGVIRIGFLQGEQATAVPRNRDNLSVLTARRSPSPSQIQILESQENRVVPNQSSHPYVITRIMQPSLTKNIPLLRLVSTIVGGINRIPVS